MPSTITARLRRLWLDVHLWLGVGLLVVFIPLSVSGSILVWHDPLDRALHGARYAVSGNDASLPASAYAEAATRAFAERATLTQVRLPTKPGDPVVAVGRINGPVAKGARPRSLNAWIDPPTARVLETAEIAKGFTMVTHRLHGSLLIPGQGVGRKVVGWLGWAMFISSATGLWLWWPRHGGFIKGLRWRRGASTLFNLHHMVGFWICLPLAVLSLTGVYISFPKTSHALFGAPPPAARPSGPGRDAPPVETPRLTIDQAAAVALAANPGATLASANWPTKGKEPAWRMEVAMPDRARAAAVQVVDATGEVKDGRGLPAPGGNRDPVSKWMRQVHDGNDMGVVWQVVIFLGGIAPAVLSITGLVMWLRRRRRRIAQTRRMAEA